MKKINAYQCDFCRKYLKTKGAMKNHESYCFANPEKKACRSCIYKEWGNFLEPEESLHRCEKGIDLSNGLKMNCGLHKSKFETP